MDDRSEYSARVRVRTARGLKSLRTASGWSQSQLARKCGISLFTIQKWEQAKTAPALDSLMWLCKCAGWKLSDVLGGGQHVGG